jgi:hypothetical protein
MYLHPFSTETKTVVWKVAKRSFQMFKLTNFKSNSFFNSTDIKEIKDQRLNSQKDLTEIKRVIATSQT